MLSKQWKFNDVSRYSHLITLLCHKILQITLVIQYLHNFVCLTLKTAIVNIIHVYFDIIQFSCNYIT